MECYFGGCIRTAHSRGLCKSHYHQKHIRGVELTPLRPYTPRKIKRETEARINSCGYLMEWMPDHPSSQKGGRILQHRLRMEEFLGRSLLPHETVHHKNGIRTDNRISNLELRTGQHGHGIAIEDAVEQAVETLATYAPHLLSMHTRTVKSTRQRAGVQDGNL